MIGRLQTAEIVSRHAAKAVGGKFYFTGKPCKNGHAVTRFVSDTGCTECKRIRSHEWYADKPRAAAKTRKWRSDHTERVLATGRAWRAQNREKVVATDARYRERHPDKARQKYREWYWRNVERERARARARQRGHGEHTPLDIEEIYQAQRGRCAYCRSELPFEDVHVDHIMPLAKGGGSKRQNLQVTCQSCNQRKNAKHPVVFAREMGLLI
jgi:5-methylcytosine-specific restriction endonuclease McrA